MSFKSVTRYPAPLNRACLSNDYDRKSLMSQVLYNSVQKGHQMMPFPCALRQILSRLSDNFSNNARTNGTAAFADCEAQTFIHGDRVNQGNNHFDVVARHYHLYAFRQFY
jgi:hypothetical protein